MTLSWGVERPDGCRHRLKAEAQVGIFGDGCALRGAFANQILEMAELTCLIIR